MYLLPIQSLDSNRESPFWLSSLLLIRILQKAQEEPQKTNTLSIWCFFFLSPWVYKEKSAALGITLSFDKAALAARSHSQIFHWQNKWFLIEVSFSFPRRPAGRGRFLTMQNKINNKSLASPHEPDNCQIAVPLKAKLN